MTENGFSQGVEPGGLRSRNEIKILICYLLQRLDKPLTRDELNEIICGEEIANYFELNQAVEQLNENGNIVINENNELHITEIGKQNLVQLEHDIPYVIREKAFQSAVNLQTRIRREHEHSIKIESLENGYNVTLSVLDSDDELMSIKLFVADYEQAQSVKEKFLSDPVKVYSEIIALLMA
ncbi:MAG: DUF4364 family protein [Ruminococcus sp.]|nr:DUF4364 family protein [Candidatus Copronaster equi]